MEIFTGYCDCKSHWGKLAISLLIVLQGDRSPLSSVWAQFDLSFFGWPSLSLYVSFILDFGSAERSLIVCFINCFAGRQDSFINCLSSVWPFFFRMTQSSSARFFYHGWQYRKKTWGCDLSQCLSLLLCLHPLYLSEMWMVSMVTPSSVVIFLFTIMITKC